MSELNVYHHELRPDEYDEFYLKYEADKVIVELKAQKAQAEDDCAYWKNMSRKCADDNEVMAKQRAEAFKQRTEALNRERHHKYKRCWTMAKMCGIMSAFEDGEWYAKWINKWYKRWCELAEKFKEAK